MPSSWSPELQAAAIGALVGGLLGMLGAIIGGWSQGWWQDYFERRRDAKQWVRRVHNWAIQGCQESLLYARLAGASPLRS